MSERTVEPLDFNKLEDRFFCIDVLTRARFSIKNSETELAVDIDRIITSLTAFSQNPSPAPVPEMERQPQSASKPGASNDLMNGVDLTAPRDEQARDRVEIGGANDDDGDGIVDLLTGTKIR
nr:hypothetical protein [Desulfobulbaceae bacterium]